MDEKKVTIIDVARVAGVSKGTVDRVLHNRGEVSSRSAEKVKKAIKELNYHPNIYASMLASKKMKIIAVLQQSFSEGDYWANVYEGYQQAAAQVSRFNVQVRPFFFDQYDSRSFKKACADILESSPDGVAISPMFKNDSLVFAKQLSAKGIPYVYVDSKVEDGNYFSYFGMPMYQSGYLCASLLMARCTPESASDVLAVRVRRDKAGQSDPTVSRREGFADYMASFFPETNVHNLFVNPQDPSEISEALQTFFKEHPEVKNIVMFNSRIHLISDFLSANPDPERHVIGFDNLEQNIHMLQDGLVEMIISQHISEQSRKAVGCLADHIQIGSAPATKDNYMHMDILTRYNLENY